MTQAWIETTYTTPSGEQLKRFDGVCLKQLMRDEIAFFDQIAEFEVVKRLIYNKEN